MDALHRVAKALLERETLDRVETDLLLEGKELPPLKPKASAAEKKDEAVPEEKPSNEPLAGPDFPGKPQPFPRPDTP